MVAVSGMPLVMPPVVGVRVVLILCALAVEGAGSRRSAAQPLLSQKKIAGGEASGDFF
jgi:hypothetical protein